MNQPMFLRLIRRSKKTTLCKDCHAEPLLAKDLRKMFMPRPTPWFSTTILAEKPLGCI
jgi:hypothetical protein